MAKEVKKLRGTARIYDDDSLEFRPYEAGKPVQKGVKKARKSSFYATEGEKESSYVMHLRVDKNSLDPAAELSEDFDKLIKNVGGDAQERFTGKVLDRFFMNVFRNNFNSSTQSFDKRIGVLPSASPLPFRITKRPVFFALLRLPAAFGEKKWGEMERIRNNIRNFVAE